MFTKILLLLSIVLILAIGSHYIPAAKVLAPVVPAIDKIEAYLTEQESIFTDITDGAEKTINWASPSKAKTEFAVIYLHGYSATRQESAPLTQLLADQLKANAFHTRLTGHGRTDEMMASSKLKLWKKDALEAYQVAKTIGDKVIVVSVSTGSTLSTWLSAQEGTEQIVAQLMISPNFDIPNKDAYLIDLPLGIGLKIAEFTSGKNHTWTPKNELQEKYWSTNHPIKAVRPMIQLLKEVKKIDKQTIITPTLMVYSAKDTVISISAIEENFKAWGTSKKQITQFNDSVDTHVLASAIVSPDSIQPMLTIMLEFLYQYDITPRPVLLIPESEPTEVVEI